MSALLRMVPALEVARAATVVAEEEQQWRPLVRAYLASTTFMDSQVGPAGGGMKATGRADNTIIVLWSDNGWHLGEKLITGKNSLWDRSTHVPLHFRRPGHQAGFACTSRLNCWTCIRLSSSYAASRPARDWRATASSHNSKMRMRRAPGPRSPRTIKTTTRCSPSIGDTSAMRMGPKSLHTAIKTRTSESIWHRCKVCGQIREQSPNGCPK